MKRILFGAALSVCLFGQPTPSEVVSVKRNLSGDTGTDLDIDAGRLTATNMTVVRLIANAYGVLASQDIEGGPAWIRSERYDIQATPAASSTLNQPQIFRQELIKAILRDRFQLVAREGTREEPIFVLTMDKQLRIKHSDGPALGSFHTNGGRMTARGVTIDQFARRLPAILGRPLEDRTGLMGVYDFELEWAPEAGEAHGTGVAPSLFTAVREQLGLRLTADKGPVRIVVVRAWNVRVRTDFVRLLLSFERHVQHPKLLVCVCINESCL